MLTVMTVGLAGLFATAASTQTFHRPETRVGAFWLAGGQIVGAHEPVLAGQRRARAPSYDRMAVGSCVAAENASGPGTALEPMWAQAPNNGFLGGWSTTETLQPGTLIDRYRGETGRFFSPAGTPLDARSLPSGAGPLNIYEVLKPFDVQGGIAGPAFGQPGLGVQYMGSQPVADLIEGGFIKPVTP